MNINKLANQINFKEQGVLLIDLSYLFYTRFYATRIWYNFQLLANIKKFYNYNKIYIEAKNKQNWKDDTFLTKLLNREFSSDKEIEIAYKENVNLLQDWFKNSLFMDKFKETFFRSVNQLQHNKKISNSNTLYVIDSPFSDNWRHTIIESYKGNRSTSHKKNKFNNWDILDFVKKELLVNKHSYMIEGLEADDVVALLIKNIKRFDKTNRKFKYYIVATDKDYLQLCNDRTFLIDIKGKYINDKELKNKSNLRFLIEKILLGDKSDFIKACYMKKELFGDIISSSKDTLKCTPKKVEQLLDNTKTYNLLVDMLNICRESNTKSTYDSNCINIENTYFVDNQFTKNAKLIDFQFIPKHLYEKINW
jgi:hypothetical protein